MDALSDPAVHTVVFMKSAQVGATEIVCNIAGFHIDQDPSPILVMQPTLDMAQAWSKDRLAPMLRDTPALRGKVKDPRSRDSGNTLLHKIFDGGHITIVGANSAAGLASRPIRVVLADEVDRYPASAGTEGDPVELAKKRSTTFWNRKLVLTSTPTIKGESRIEAAFNESDRRKFWVPCPHCGEAQVLKWAQAHWAKDEESEKERPSTARYVCEHCGVLWGDAERWASIQTAEQRGGGWRAEAEFNGVAGFWVNEIYSSWVTLADMAERFLAAKPYPDRLQTFVNTALAETWEERGEVANPEGINRRRQNYGPDDLPEGVEFLTAGVDVHGDRLECEVVGWNRDERSWGVLYKVFHGDPAGDALWIDLDRFLMQPFKVGDRLVRVVATAIDSGGHHAEVVYRFCANRMARRVWAIKGMAGEGKPIWPLRASKTNTNDRVFIVGVDTAKDAVTSRWGIEEGPGSAAIPADVQYGYDEQWIAQMTAEQRVTRYRQGRPYRAWIVEKGRRNEAFDCRVYAMAAMRSVYRGQVEAEAPSPPKKRARVSRSSLMG